MVALLGSTALAPGASAGERAVDTIVEHNPLTTNDRNEGSRVLDDEVSAKALVNDEYDRLRRRS